ncbi:HlyD family secretion protein [Robiginitalea sp. SC105]|uniref:HlyD family secretion protein n=1 Tax=Robiginitalea sp. SC105 TaxID=2762332 RepID=UPI00163A984A|nr:HlyD family efflux transporter periplasmic adaptor subunit [Robiginitalea sp. SC105]MBC2837928.1 HlyD family efflux transporter periplasmic adaptor subunit [Robiginitalea sp. SC105]
MLNITENKLNKEVDLKVFESGRLVFHHRHYKHFNRFLMAFTIIGLIILFLPWTQTINGNGYLTTLTPDQRPQTVQSAIPGRIEKWYVREGDFVEAGDTILVMSEVKDEYFDPRLVDRTQMQIDAKSRSVGSYREKVRALEAQIVALGQERGLKLEQTRNKLMQANLKVKSDSIDLEAARTGILIAQRQFDRTSTLEDEGLKAVTDVEEKRLKLQEAQAKLISAENKLLASKNEVLNARMEVGRIQAEYTDKISKAQSDLFTAQSDQFDTEAQVTKLENQFTNYERRRDLNVIRAPQNGFVNKAIQSGIGQTFKEGEQLVSIMPTSVDLAVETYVAPIDLPLIHLGEKFRIQFDGWPAIIFSGWPNVSYGTYGGVVVAIETNISQNGKYRILIAPDPDDHPWPAQLRVGSGAYSLGLLQDVPIWFELWRQLNGFPPNYYNPNDTGTAKSMEKQ